MKLEALQAAKGDCLLLHHDGAGGPQLVLVDGGPSGVYPRTLRPRLDAIRSERIADGHLTEDEPLMIDLVIISHIDDDHINGIKALLTDIADNGAPFRVGRLWHNSFRSLLDADASLVSHSIPSSVQATASFDAELVAALTQHGGGQKTDESVAMITASLQQGYDVLDLARRLHIPINPEIGGRAIEATGAAPLQVDGLQITVVGPPAAELEALRASYKKWLKRSDRGEPPTASLLASMTDDSIANLSSIVLLIEEDKERYLLTGDARGDKMMRSVRALGLLDENDQLPVDVFKVPHHGSDRNMTAECFAMFPAKRYIFSGNGEHGNPERHTLELLAQACEGQPVTVELTYPPSVIDRERARFWNAGKGNAAFDPGLQGVESFLVTQAGFDLRHPSES